MKKLTLTKQIFILYTLVLLVTSITFYSILSNRLSDIYTNINYDKLDEFALATKVVMEHGYDIDFLEWSETVEFIIWEDDNDVYYSKKIIEIMGQEYIDNLFIKIQETLVTEEVYRGFLSDGDYYYSAIKTANNAYILGVVQGGVINEMRNDAAIQIMILFLVVLCGGGIVIGSWSNLLVIRISKINKVVQKMPSSDYSEAYIDTYGDEVGLLSDSIDSMRVQIYENEETKKEIMQNLSHDLKTPLAVIKSYAEAIVDEVESPDAGLLIMKQADKLQHKVEKLLQLNRLRYLEMETPFVEVKMKNIIEPIVNNLKYLSNLTFELSLDDSIFMGYEENYYTVVENILSNAMRYAKSKIVITLKNGVLSFYNDGEHIEDKFINADFKAYEKGSKGVFGVGMSIVKKTIFFFDLDLEVQNEEVGVTFIIKKSK